MVNKFNRLLRKLGYELRRIHPPYRFHQSRFEYQSRFVEFDFAPGSRVLDIGSGSEPFPHATVLADRYLEPSVHRGAKFRFADKPVVVCDIHNLPFEDDAFDYVYCSHVLEHVGDPIVACSELIRIGQSGYIETPTFGKDVLFSWAEKMHKWYVTAIDNRLIFFEYTSRQRDGLESSSWREIVHSKRAHPLRRAFLSHLDLFNVMFEWDDQFECIVYYLDGRERRLANCPRT